LEDSWDTYGCLCTTSPTYLREWLILA